VKDVRRKPRILISPAAKSLNGLLASSAWTEGFFMYSLDRASRSFLLIAAISIALLLGSLIVFSLNH
jgi:hypothetical protein